MNEIKIHFKGPYSFSKKENFLFKSGYAESSGVYIWTNKSNVGNLIHYIGETSNFSKRHKEHLINILGLNYGIFDPDSAKEGKANLIWKGLWRDKSPNAIEELLKNYLELSQTVINYINSIDIFLAEINIEKNIRKHIEGSIGWNLRNNHQKFKALYPDDNHIGKRSVTINKKLIISSEEKILGLDSEIDL